MPVGQIRIDEGRQRARTVEEFSAASIHFLRRVLKGFVDQLILGGEVGVEAAMGQSQCLHKRLQPRGAYAVTSKACGRFLNDALMGLGLMVLGVPHDGCLLISNSHHMRQCVSSAVVYSSKRV